MMSKEATCVGMAVAKVIAGQDKDAIVHALVSHCLAAFMQMHRMHPEQAKTLLCAYISDQPFTDFIPDGSVVHGPN